MKRKNLWPALAVLCFAASIFLVSQFNLKPAYGASGSVISSFFLPPHPSSNNRISQGLAYDGTYLLYLDVYDPMVYQISITAPNVGSLVGSFVAPERSEAYHKGVAWDGTDIWVSKAGPGYKWIRKIGGGGSPITTSNNYPYDITYADGFLYEVGAKTGKVFKINATTGSTVASFDGPNVSDENCFGLTNDGSNLYVGTYGRNPRIFKYTFGGSLVSSFAAPSGHPLGLAYDGTYLWCVDDETEYFYQFEK